MFNKKLFEQKVGGEPISGGKTDDKSKSGSKSDDKSKSSGKTGGEPISGGKTGGNVNKTKNKESEVTQTPDETGESIYIDQKEYPTDLFIKLYQVGYMGSGIYSQSYPFIKAIQDGLSTPNLDMPLNGSDFNPGWQD